MECFFSSRLSNESLIGLCSLDNKDVVKLQGGYYLVLSKKIKESNPRLVTLRG